MTETPNPPAKKSASKKAAASKPADKATKMNPYLPSLPTGWAYTQVQVHGPDGVAMSATVNPDGKVSLIIDAGELANTTAEHPDMHSATGAFADAAKTISKIAERERELALMRTEGLANLGNLGKPAAPKAKADTPPKA